MSATFEERLKEIRESRNMTQDELGEAVGANRVAISRYENGIIRPTSKRMAALAGALGVTVEYLILHFIVCNFEFLGSPALVIYVIWRVSQI